MTISEREGPDARACLGAAIRDVRRRAGLSRREVAERDDALTADYLRRAEEGTAALRLTQLLAIARALDVPLSELVRIAEHEGEQAA